MHTLAGGRVFALLLARCLESAQPAARFLWPGRGHTRPATRRNATGTTRTYNAHAQRARMACGTAPARHDPTGTLFRDPPHPPPPDLAPHPPTPQPPAIRR
ncbi:hypothetical protein GCM10017687_79760 [Streptomyces echinatus]